MVMGNPLNDPISVATMYEHIKPSSEQMNATFYRRMMWSVLYRIALNRIEWTNLPKGMDSHLIERHLINGSTLSIHQSKDIDKPVLCKAVGNGLLNNLGLASEWNLFTLNGVTVDSNVPFDEVAILDPFYERMQVFSIIGYFVDLFDDFDQALRSNLKMQKTPAIVMASEELKLTMANIVDQYHSGAPTIYTFANNGLDLTQALTALNFNVDYVADRILIDRRQAWNDCMTYLGIDNTNQDKKERLVTDEVTGNADQVSGAQVVELDPRREFAEKVNTIYDTTITVGWRGGNGGLDGSPFDEDEESYNVQSTGGRMSNYNTTAQ